MYHYNDRFYESNCSECGYYFYAKTIREMKTLDDFHECGEPSMPQVTDGYEAIELPGLDTKPMLEKPGFIPNWQEVCLT